MKIPDQLMFKRTVSCTMPYSLDVCVEEIQNFKPSLTVETQAFVDGSTFVIRYGDPSQMKLWAVGTLGAINETTTQVDIQIQ